MGFAAGMAAGSRAYARALENYETARDSRQTREVVEEVEAARAARQAEIAEAQAEQARSAAAAAQPVGLGDQTMPLMSPTTAPTQAEQLGLVPETSTALSSPTAETARRTGVQMDVQVPEAYRDAEIARLREQAFRSRGRTGLADTAADRALALENRDYNRQRDAIGDERAEALTAENTRRWEAENARAEAEAERRAQEFELDLKAKGFEVEGLRRTSELNETMDGFKGMTPNEILNSDAYQDLNPAERTAVAATIGNLTKSEIDTASAIVQQKVDAAKDLPSLITTVNDDESITAGTSYRITDDGKGGLVLEFVEDGGDAPDGVAKPEKILFSKPFQNESEIEKYLRDAAVDPSTSATWYASQRTSIATAMAERADALRGDRIEVMKSLDGLRNDLFGGDMRLAPEERVAREEMWNKSLENYRSILGDRAIGSLQMALPDVDKPLSRSNPSAPSPRPKYGLQPGQNIYDYAVGDPASAVVDTISGAVSGAVSRSNVSVALDRNIREGRPLTSVATEDLRAAAQEYSGEKAAAAIAELERRSGESAGLR